MKPNFALHFTDDSIALLHRTRRGWVEIGTTPFAVDDLPAALAALREKAEALEPAGITTKLVIPNSQIKYLDISAPGPDAAKRRAQIAAGLEGQTPYDVADLVWDHWGKGPTVQVAVLARETLDEAEGFAAANGFNPVSFVAIPDDPAYAGEPWFGPTSHSATILKAGEKVDRDQDPIRPATPLVPEAPAEAEAAPQTEASPEIQPETAAEPLAVTPEPEPEPEPQPVAEAAPAPQPEPEPEAAPAPQAAAQAEAPLPAMADSLQDDLAAVVLTETPLSEATVDPAAIAATLAPSEAPRVAQTKAPSVLNSTVPDPDEAPMAIDVSEETIDDRAAQRRPAASVLVDPSVEDDLPPMPSGAALSAYGRRGTDLADDLPPPVADRTPPRAMPGPAAPMAAPPRKEGKAERPAGVRPPPKFSYESPGEKSPAPPTKALRGLGALVTAPSIPGGRKAKVVAPIATAAATAAAAAATAAGTATTSAKRPAGLGTRPMPVRGKPRHLGLILTGLLLIMLALAAGLSTYYISWRDQAAEPAVDVAAADPAAATDETLPAPEDEMLADLVDPAEIEAEITDEAAADGVVMETIDPNAATPAETAAAAPETAAPLPEPAPQTTVAATDPSPTVPGIEPQDEIFLAASDAAPRTVDPVSLPLPSAQGDPPPSAQQPPPPFGTVYQFDANGLIRATPEGIVTPEGVLLTAGAPPRLPPERPASIAEAAAAAAIDAALAARNATPEAAAPTEEQFVIPADPALADNRPLARPANLVPAPAAAETVTDDDAALSPELASRLAGVRPAARPGTLAAEAVAAGLIAPATASNNGSLALVAPEGTVTPLGLAISRRPAARPEDMNRAVEEAVAAAIRLPDPEPIPEDDAPYAVEENEPEVAAAAPRIPSSANVAKQATVRNAIDLRDINLIGVYGTSAERYALVRNPNGRYVKVEVGDRLDGGRVAAITASELRYEKRGRMVVLELPNS
ncbi:MAG: translation initiation factor 2 [Rhodobacteraceae bacterium]|nr:translation initiation factor 2 [Paracoccaceae bacterium]